ncbi:hypothetical protein OC835_007505, partial [Tilletia horrida]
MLPAPPPAPAFPSPPPPPPTTTTLPDSRVTIRILYSNVSGLTAPKAYALWAKADDNTLVFAAETWHVDGGRHVLLNELVASTPEARVRGTVLCGRRHGGLRLWAGKQVRQWISNVEVGPYGIA